MAKKTKRQASRGTKTTAEPSGAPVESASRPAGFASSARPADKDFNPDYSYVVKDLKRIGTLAGVFFVALIVLSFFLR